LHQQTAEYAVLGPLLRSEREHLLTRALFPPLDHMHTAAQQNRAWLDTARVALAVERFRRQHRRWPASLEELPRELLASIPADPFDGQPLRYLRTDFGVAIYAVGPDGQDDEGEIGPRQGGEGVGRDVGFRLWDPEKRRLPAPWPPSATAATAVGLAGAARAVPVDPLGPLRLRSRKAGAAGVE